MRMTKVGKGKTHVSLVLYRLPVFLAKALDTFAERRDLTRREDAIYRVIEDHPEIQRIINEHRLEAKRVTLETKRRLEGRAL